MIYGEWVYPIEWIFQKGDEFMKSIRAFSDDRYDYYELTTPLGYVDNKDEFLVPARSIFVHDTDDHELGSIVNGCLKLCWTPDGNTYGSLCGGTVIFHSEFINTPLFKLVKSRKNIDEIATLKESINELKIGIEKVENQLDALNDKLEGGN